MSEVTVLIWPP